MGSWPTFSYHPASLKEIEVDGSNPNYCSVDGVLYNKDKSELIYYPSGKEDATFKVPEWCEIHSVWLHILLCLQTYIDRF